MINFYPLDYRKTHFYIRAAGTVAQVEKAFAVQINDYSVAGKTVRANASDPYVAGPAATLIQSISGLDDNAFQSPGMVRSTTVPSSARLGQRFSGTVTVHRSTFGGYPKASYTGNEYVGNGGGCAYTPADIRAAYNLNALYTEGYDGTGQTIVFVEACGSPTVLSDANAFSERFGLPRLTSSNFSVISMGPSACAGSYASIDADVEWAHAVAPGAALALIFAIADDLEDVDEAMFYAVDQDLGYTICDDNALSENLMFQAEADKENLISEIAAVEGISANYPGGVAVGELVFGSPVVAPADGPYGTGIGGITLALGADDSIAFETAWEDHVSEVLLQGRIFDPSEVPVPGGYLYGGLGGRSAYFAKPSFQDAAVSGTRRGVPDFSWVADPNAGLIVVSTKFTQEPPQSWFAFGGTGVATSMFSGLWAIANQKAGVALGQAAFPVIIGGDCSIMLGGLTACRDALGRIGLVFVDGHEDAYPPHQSPTGEIADLEFGFAIGRYLEGLPPAFAARFPAVAPNDAVIVGARDTADLKHDGVASVAPTIRVLPDAKVRRSSLSEVGAHEADRLVAAGVRGVWLHTDLDVLSTEALPAVDYRRPGGFTWTELTDLARSVVRNPAALGWDVTIYNPDLDPGETHAGRIVRLVADVLAS